MGIDRYKIVEGSESGHCCFDFTVVDTEQPYMPDDSYYDGRFKQVCEAFYMEEALLICKSLNEQDRKAKEK